MKKYLAATAVALLLGGSFLYANSLSNEGDCCKVQQECCETQEECCITQEDCCETQEDCCVAMEACCQ